jgi:hypothetical protein
MTSYVNPFTGQTIQPSQVGYEQLTISADTTLEWPVNGNTDSVVANIIEVTASVASLKLYMPAATQVSTGQSALIRNIGANSFTVVKSDGSTIVSIASGVAQYIYVTNNATIPGTWSTVTFGAGTSSANAATLAGYGLKAVSTTLNQAYPLTTYNSTATLTSAERASFAVYTGGVGSIILPSASVVGNDWFVNIRNNGTGILTVTPTGADTIDGNASQQLQIGESFVVVSNGTNAYNSFGYGQSSTFFYTILSKSVTGLGATITLSSSEAANVIQEYVGTLAANTQIIFPSTVQLYAVTNDTSGAFSLTFRTAAVGGATVTIPQAQTLILICDGTNVYNANSATVSSLAALTLNSGTAAAPSLNYTGDTTTGFYRPSSGHLGFSLLGVSKMTLEADGLHVVDGIKGGVFT